MKSLKPTYPRLVMFAPPGTDPGLGWIHGFPGRSLDRAEYRLALKAKVATLVGQARADGSTIPADLWPPLSAAESDATTAERLWMETSLGSLLNEQVDRVREWPVKVPARPRKVSPLNLSNLLFEASRRA